MCYVKVMIEMIVRVDEEDNSKIRSKCVQKVLGNGNEIPVWGALIFKF